MTECALARERIATMLSGEIEAEDRLGLDRHLAGCAECSGEADRLRRAIEMLAVGEVPDPGPAYWASFGGRLRARLDAARRRTSLLRWTAALAAVAVVVAGLAVLRGGWRTAPAGPAEATARDASRPALAPPTGGRALTVEAADANLRDALRRAAAGGEGTIEIDTLLDEIAPGDPLEETGLAGPPTPEDERRLSGDLLDSRG